MPQPCAGVSRQAAVFCRSNTSFSQPFSFANLETARSTVSRWRPASMVTPVHNKSLAAVLSFTSSRCSRVQRLASAQTGQGKIVWYGWKEDEVKRHYSPPHSTRPPQTLVRASADHRRAVRHETILLEESIVANTQASALLTALLKTIFET